MPLVRLSVREIAAAQQLYEAATKFINHPLKHERWGGEPTQQLLSEEYYQLVAAAKHCKKEFENHGS